MQADICCHVCTSIAISIISITIVMCLCSIMFIMLFIRLGVCLCVSGMMQVHISEQLIIVLMITIIRTLIV